jgi:hypothetical protein
MRPDPIEVVYIRVEYALELLLMQDEQMIEALAPHAPEKPLTDGIRSRGLIRCFEDLNVTRLCNTGEVPPELAIVIPNEILRSLSKGCGFSQLLRYPCVAGRSCDAYMDHFPRLQFNNEEGKERTEQQVGDWKEVTGPHIPGMSAQEGCPVLFPWSSRAHVSHVLLDRAFADVKTQLEQFAPDPFRSPQSIIPCHLPDQSHCLLGYFWFRSSRSGLALPIQLPSLAMPTQKRFWLDDEQRLFPGPNHPCEKHQEHPICLRACWSFDLPTEDNELLAEKGVFCHEFGFASGKVSHRSQQERSERRFCPVSETLLKQLKIYSRQSLYRVENMIHSMRFPFMKMSRRMLSILLSLWLSRKEGIHGKTFFKALFGAWMSQVASTAFNSGPLAPGSTFSFTFTNAGTYSYHCNIHPYMMATIVVQ